MLLVKLKTPDWATTYGQNGNPTGLSLNGNLFEWETVCKVSSHTDRDGNPNATPYPLIPTWFYDENQNQFETIETEENNGDNSE